MKFIRPDFYDRFVCIADKCTDNCCIGWEIDIDSASMARFESVRGEFGEKLRAAIKRGDCPTFANTDGERCSLLREDGLCELVLNLGEDSLCDICALHPRFFEWFGEEKEAGLGLCCEEAARLLFEDSAPLKLVCSEIDEEDDTELNGEVFELLKAAREQLFRTLNDRSRPLGARLCACAEFSWELQHNLDNCNLQLPEIHINEYEQSFESVPTFLELLKSTEPVGRDWTERINRLCERSDELCGALTKFRRENSLWQYDKLAAYCIYRYFLKASFDGEVVSKVGLACAAALFAELSDCMTWLDSGNLTDFDRICTVKLYSKQTDYSDEVAEALCDAFWDIPNLTPGDIARAI
jgi:lysine-N-methylase